MGPYLDTPETTKKTFYKETDKFVCAACEMQGWRVAMEDACICQIDFDEGISLFGVFDGHGGSSVALYAVQNLPKLIKSSSFYALKDYPAALKEAYLKLDKDLSSEHGKKEVQEIFKECRSPHDDNKPDASGDVLIKSVGCTACVAMITPTEIFVANSGDSRCVLCKSNVAIDMSKDHKPQNPEEEKRIKKAGGEIVDERVKGCLSLSRAFGDYEYKGNEKLPQEEQMVTALPDVRQISITSDCEYLIIACDGIWDCLSSQKAVDFIKEQKAKAMYKCDKTFKLSRSIELLFDSILSPDPETSSAKGTDNMSCIVINFGSKDPMSPRKKAP